MSGIRAFRDPEARTARFTVVLPVEIDRQLRALAARRGGGTSALIRGWIEKELLAEQRWLRRSQETRDAAD